VQRMERQTQAKMRNQALDIIRHVIVAESPFTDSEVFLVDLIKDGRERLRTLPAAGSILLGRSRAHNTCSPAKTYSGRYQ
jgi:hypothetical protein